MSTLGSVLVKIGVDMGEFSKSMQRVEQGLQDVGKKAEQTGNKMSDSFSNFKQNAITAIGAVATAMGGLAIMKGIQFNADMETALMSFDTLLGSAEKAQKLINDLKEFGQNTPFEFKGLQESAKTMLGMGVDANNIMPYLQSLGDAVSAVGGTQEDLQGVSMAIGQMLTKGKISSEEMNQLSERGIKAWDVLADKMGVSKQKLMEMIEQGKVMADDVVPLLVQGLGENSVGAMEKQAKTFTGMLSTLKDKVNDLLGNAMKPLFEVLKGIMEWFLELSPSTQTFIIAITGLGIAIAPLLLILPTLVTSFGLIAGAIGAISAPVAIAIGVIAGLIAVGIAVYTHWDEISAWLAELWNKIKINVLTVWNSLKNYLLGLAKGILDYFLNWTIIGAVIKHWDEIKLKTITVWNYLKGLIAGVAGIIWQTVSDKFNSVKNTVSNIWESVKNTISDKIQSAKNLVRDGLDAIKGFFDRLKLKLPHIPLPHFSIRGSFSLNPPSVPSLGVNWYKNGGVFNGDSIIGVGEAGAEAVVPLTGHRMIPFAKAIAEQMPNGGNSNGNGHVTIEVPVVLDGREVARITAKHMASELLRMGTKAVRSRGQ